MKKSPEIKRILHELEFDESWFDSGFVSAEKLQELWLNFQSGDDIHKEHYRWRAFTSYIENNKEIDQKDLEKLYRLGKIDADYSMGTAIRITILQRKDCPVSLENEALNSAEKPLIKAIRRKLGLENN